MLEVKAKVDRLVQLRTSNVVVWGNITPQSQNDMQALDSMIDLVDNWLQDDSKYDEEVYPLIEVGLIQN